MRLRRRPRPRFDLYRDQAGEWRWRLLAANGRLVSDSGEGYGSRRDARRAAKAVKGAAASATIEGVE